MNTPADTPADTAARCTAAGLQVLAVAETDAQVAVTVRSVPQSASGLAGLTQRLGGSPEVRAVTVSLGDGTGSPAIWFMRDKEIEQDAG